VLIAGIDYSLCSPAVTVIDTQRSTAVGHYLTDTKRNIRKVEFFGWYTMVGTGHRSYSSQQERYEQIANWTLEIVRGCDAVRIEDYAMGAKGKVFHIAENTGLMKWMLWKEQVPFDLVAPTALKRFATGKGNADKTAMHTAFQAKAGFDLSQQFGGRIDNPVSDLVDSMWLAWMLQEEKSPLAGC
jgi:Holliday junction resolvasome RuvABC endonuclease subunit